MANSKTKLSNGKTIPTLGFGTWMMSEPEQLEIALNKALEVGCRHFDTANVYGNEQLIGNVLKKWFDQGKITREELFITTKLPPIGMTPAKVLYFLRLSLERLQLSYVDLYLIHVPFGFSYTSDETIPFKDGKVVNDMNTDLIGVWEEMEEAVRLGLTKSVGVSNFNEEQVQRICKVAQITPVNVQVEMHAYFQQRELRKLCASLDVVVTAYAPLGSSGRSPFHAAANIPFNDLGLLQDPLVVEVAEKHQKTPAQVLIKFLLQQNVVVLCKSGSPERVQSNFDVWDFRLNPEDMYRLESLDKGNAGRSFIWDFFPGAQDHPEYPHKEVLFREK
ncbi:unnamed protein product [Allacma fusca]|uniref:NADP-dependent oxidoreductase domain-containing protein n=1 Tax=Allacma fusca TaxID=39272 RepID=A0A8J2LJX4_9HEXA|nr:unnamed protein product [Allacma fusca]CAG7838233.1 unnamed protein product [Allacma fusca]